MPREKSNQSSDAGPSNRYEEHLDSLPYLSSDPIQSFTPDLNYRHQTNTPAPLFEVPQPISDPESLRRVGPDRKKIYVLYNDMSKEQFIAWWLQTQYATVEGNGKRINWKSKHSSEVWDNFDQVAHQLTGEAKVMCRRCGKVLPHPQEKGDGTNSMKRHLGSNSCRRVTSDQSQQQGIQQSFEFAV
ncbi:hypothetical protein N7508_007519 [Penicillium antarcticum]|uniref:uncharacterized protein n=1 Tax=Penicillium antarcticum TaxID=416450 RepID=UPI0023A2E313|nr:uncharacterized protein N7508_007479 [Penicillium antarcticum]XP_058317985.1 uncharacterized protein N7508_007519 [Penicillium antarcticum]KAJ5300236.1 hypothetical protein N7508_007479 [Penicillium antarcticum]KAJ5300276.1 hypothetical protein N7508_007519 [Penicillium antarcticum]